MTQKQALAELETLVGLGFDHSAVVANVSRTGIRVACSQCEALVICGVACHESNCPNEVHECRGCAQLVPARVRYCADCQ